MEIREIEIFLTLAEELHFRRTASRLYLSAARVSQTVRALEREIGGPLFIRNSREVRLTPLGEQFRDDARNGLAQLHRALDRAQAAARGIGEVLRVGYFACIGGPLVTALATRFEARHPETNVVVTALSTSTGFDVLREGSIDILLTWSPDGDAEAVVGDGRVAGPICAHDPRSLLVTVGHPLADRDALDMDEVADYELLDLPSSVPQPFLDAWTPPTAPSGKPVRHCVDDLQTMIGRSGVCFDDLLSTVARTHLPHLSIRSLLAHRRYPDLTLVPVPELPPCVLVTVWQAERETDTIRTFAQAAAEFIPSLRERFIPQETRATIDAG